MSKMKKTAASMIALMLAGCMAFPAMADLSLSGKGQPDTEMQITETKGKYSIITRKDAILDSGMLWNDWNEEQKNSYKKGSENLLTTEDLTAVDPDVKILEEDGLIYSISGRNLPMKAADEQEAAYTAYTLADVLGFPKETELWFLSEIHPADNSSIYVFEQVFEGETVPGSTIRIVTDENGQVTDVFNSLFKEMPESSGKTVIDASQAQQCVEEHIKESGEKTVILPDYITQILIPQEEDMSDPSDEVLPDLLYWVVMAQGSEDPDVYPYTAHYVSAEGEWQFSIPVHGLEDENILAGSNSTCVFDNMEPAKWSGTVTYYDGNTAQITVPVMYDKDADRYYLGDINRRIAIGEYYDFFFEDQQLILVSSEDNTGWYDDDLITYYNYIRTWDFYNEMGWKGPDGSGTPSLLLRNMCTADKEPFDNAAYFSYCRGWQLFAYDNTTYYFGEALDVMAHEFTHCVTTTSQGANLYFDDQGAINEALSDIMGNICEIQMDGEEEGTWLMGEDSLEAIRSMSDPHEYSQPEYVWDIFYAPSAYKPNDMNDRGGVHTNSSILNLLAARLYFDAGLSTEEMKEFWMMVICGMTPGTDYFQMADVMQWALRAAGYIRYEDSLNKYIEQGQLKRTQIPEKIEDGRILVSLTLPDTPVLSDEYWTLAAVQIEMPGLSDIIKLLAALITLEYDSDEDETDSALTDILSGFVSQQMTWVSDESRTMKMIIEDRPTIYMMMNMDPDTFELRGLAVLADDKWIDLMSAIEGMAVEEDFTEDLTEDDAAVEVFMALMQGGVGIIGDLIKGVITGNSSDISGSSGKYIEISAQGLDSIELHEISEESALDIAV